MSGRANCVTQVISSPQSPQRLSSEPDPRLSRFTARLGPQIRPKQPRGECIRRERAPFSPYDAYVRAPLVNSRHCQPGNLLRKAAINRTTLQTSANTFAIVRGSHHVPIIPTAYNPTQRRRINANNSKTTRTIEENSSFITCRL
jgi:hypothetical protein